MQKHGYVWGRHYLPRDGDTQRLGMEKNWTPRQMLEEHGLRPNMTYGKAKEPKRTYLDEYMGEPKR